MRRVSIAPLVWRFLGTLTLVERTAFHTALVAIRREPTIDNDATRSVADQTATFHIYDNGQFRIVYELIRDELIVLSVRHSPAS